MSKQPSLFDNKSTTFNTEALTMTAALKAKEWFFIVDNGEILLFSPKSKDELPPLGKAEEIRDVIKIANILRGESRTLDNLHTPYWKDYAKSLIEGGTFVCEGGNVALNKDFLNQECLVDPAMLFLAFINSIRTGLPFLFSLEGIKSLDDKEAVKKVKEALEGAEKQIKAAESTENNQNIGLKDYGIPITI